ncbi:hypothetical protein [Nocardioides sp. SYSU D00038]|uniref:hypothetical protein n=1 Tax=Nocardioides sp. SYSU D00038 TaxID=2812554 RepID=UPI0019673DFB|nr:hypothetical protein [Nocardioides sp. SYSU D00038]
MTGVRGPVRGSVRVRWSATVAVGALAGGLLLGGCGEDGPEGYCEAVADHQEELTEIIGAGGPDALLRALPVFRDLRAAAPRDVRDEWQQVVGALEDLADALDEAGVEPSSYDPEAPPSDLAPEERDRIEAAATALASPQTTEALAGLQQQARDVCKSPLTL